MGFIAPIVAGIGGLLGWSAGVAGTIGGIAKAAAPAIGSISSLFGGSGTKQEKGAITSGQEELKNVFNYALPTAKTMTGAGTGALGEAKDYWSSILSGTRPAQMAAIAPETAAINEQAEAARKKEAWFGTSRGGGTAASAQEAETRRMTDINQALFGARPKAAGAVADIGVQQLSAGLRALGMSQDAINSIIQSASTSRPQSRAEFEAQQEELGTLVAQAPDIATAIKGLFKKKDQQQSADLFMY